MTVLRLNTPLTEEEVRTFRIGDILYVSGRAITARDETHLRALQFSRHGRKLPYSFEGGVLYHCGPLARKRKGNWEILAAGPTTSMRMELSEAEFIKEFKPRIIVGKGGMGEKTLEALKKVGVVYCDFTGGAAVLATVAIECVEGVDWLDLGMSEALWVFKIKDFGPLTVTMDSHGGDMHSELLQRIKAKKDKIHSDML